MNTETRAAMQAALAYVHWQAFGECRTADWDGAPPTAAEIDTLLVAALAQPEVEPIAYISEFAGRQLLGHFNTSAVTLTKHRAFEDDIALYTTPQQSEPDTDLQLTANLLQEYGLQALDIVEAFKKRPDVQAEPVAWIDSDGDIVIPLSLSYSFIDVNRAIPDSWKALVYAAPQQPAPGWQLVPIEPTDAMLDAARAVDLITIRSVYAEMLKAAPKATGGFDDPL